MCRKARDVASGVSLGKTITGAYLGGNSKYSNESFEELMIM